MDEYPHHRPVPPTAGGAGTGSAAGGRAHPAPLRRPLDRLSARGRGAEPAGSPYAWPNKQRMPNLLLVGPTNNGKSMIVEKFRRTTRPAPTPTRSTSRCWSCRCRPSRP